ncbi:MAG: hypothetical protein V5B59_17685 [Candidatus Accumulibacter contiguus]
MFEFGDVCARTACWSGKGNDSAAVQGKFLVLQKQLLLAVDRHESAIGTDIRKYEMLASPLNQRVVARGAAIANRDLTTRITAHEQAGSVLVEHFHNVTITYAKPQFPILHGRMRLDNRFGRLTRMLKPEHFEDLQFSRLSGDRPIFQGAYRQLLMRRQKYLCGAAGQHLPGAGQPRQGFRSVHALAEELTKLLDHGSMMKTDLDRQLNAGDGWQVGDPPLHGDGRLAGIVGVGEDCGEVVPTGLHNAAVKAINATAHAFHATVNGVQGFGTSEFFE